MLLCVKTTREKGMVVIGNLGSCDQAFVSLRVETTNIKISYFIIF